jgi:hypothetical protein
MLARSLTSALLMSVALTLSASAAGGSAPMAGKGIQRALSLLDDRWGRLTAKAGRHSARRNLGVGPLSCVRGPGALA